MTDRERIEVLERRVDFLEESLKETLKQANRIADLLIKGTKKHEPQTDCDGCQHYADEYTADACYECKRSYADRYEPQTEREGE